MLVFVLAASSAMAQGDDDDGFENDIAHGAVLDENEDFESTIMGLLYNLLTHTMSVYSEDGTKVLTTSTNTIPSNSLPKGIYFVEVYDAKGNVVHYEKISI